MTALPLATAFTDSAVTEGEFKTAITNQREFIAGLLGTDGEVATALAALGALGADTVTKTANYTVLDTDRGKVILCSGTFTLSLTAAATLGDGFTFAVVNTGSGTITIDPNSTEQIDGANTKDIDEGGWAVVTCTGSAFWTMGTTPATGSLIGYQVFTASGTYTKATNNPSFVIVEVVGGGGNGGTTGTTAGNAGGGGGGGGYCIKKILASALASSETVTVGGAGATSSFGSICSATGGAAGQTGSGTELGASGGAGGIGVNGDYNGNGGTGQSSKPASVAGSSNSGEGGCSRLMGNGVSRAGSGNGFSAPANSGGGGSGGVSAGIVAASGGSGGSGLVIVWEYR